VNIDVEDLPEVDCVHDVTEGLPFADVEFVFAEHFIEHLPVDDAFEFLRECRRVLSPSGVLRLSTPNLDWVLQSHYDPDRWHSADTAVRDCFWLNKAFRGWGHCFLYNRETLQQALIAAGFACITGQEYGHSRYPALRGVESHETFPDLPGVPHVLVVEASGIAGKTLPALVEARTDYRGAFVGVTT
jgi:predicted SAM-dependent methyltransferase